MNGRCERGGITKTNTCSPCVLALVRCDIVQSHVCTSADRPSLRSARSGVTGAGFVHARGPIGQIEALGHDGGCGGRVGA